MNKSRRSLNVYKVVFLLFLALLTTYVGLTGDKVGAVEVDSSYLNVTTDCAPSEQSTFTGMTSIPAGSYDVYTRLSKRGQTATVAGYGKVYSDSEEIPCQKIGEVQASGDKWTNVGSWTVDDGTKNSIFQISSGEISSKLDANRPSVMIVPKENPICVPNIECSVSIDGTIGYIRPTGTLPNQDSLHLVRVISPNEDVITKVIYYVDSKPVYTTDRLEAFDLRYVTYPNQKLSRVIEYASGQKLIIDQMPPDNFHDNIFNFVFRLIQYNPTVGIIVFWATMLVITWLVGVGVFHIIRRRRAYRLNHGFIQEDPETFTEAYKLREQRIDNIIAKTKLYSMIGGIAGGIFAIVFVTMNFIVSPYRVDGQSMESTYMDGNRVFINRIPVTLANMNGSGYVPSRGQVVIMHAAYGVGDSNANTGDEGDIIKRVIGLPGERVIINEGKVTIYSKEKPEGFNPDEGSEWESTMHPNDTTDNIDVTLGNDELFVTGDNRPGSVDSRLNGPITTRQLVGVVTLKLW